MEGLSDSKKVLILGHNGMLGTMCVKYFSITGPEFEIVTLPDDLRFDPDDPVIFIEKCQETKADYVINCIGLIPQKNKSATFEEYIAINTTLPMLLTKHLTEPVCYLPSTDCVFSGKHKHNVLVRAENSLADATDAYGISKARMEQGTMGKAVIIRASIIGPYSNEGLLGWFLSLEKNAQIDGYMDHIWNGVTTLQWCKFVHADMIADGSSCINLKLINYGTAIGYEKCNMLLKFAQIYNRPDVQIHRKWTGKPIYRDLYISEYKYEAPSLTIQLEELKRFQDLIK